MIRIATWNVNSLRVRLPHVIDWLADNPVEVLALQETKLTDDNFPADPLAEVGFRSVFNGQPTYNGVALLSRDTQPAPEDVLRDLPGMDDPQRRVLAATYGETRVINLYVPNGQAPGSEKFAYKLAWLEALRHWLADELERFPRLVVLGDFNIAPEDRDVHDPEEWAGSVLCSEPERAALGRLLQLGLVDAFRMFEQPEKSFSWWDYRAAAFRRDRGLRIDLILLSKVLAGRCRNCDIDRAPRALERPSDHTPVLVGLD